jgi:hypothetical protein
VLVLDAERLCLQGTDSDSERKDEVQEAKGGKGVMSDFEGKLSLDLCQLTRYKRDTKHEGGQSSLRTETYHLRRR